MLVNAYSTGIDWHFLLSWGHVIFRPKNEFFQPGLRFCPPGNWFFPPGIPVLPSRIADVNIIPPGNPDSSNQDRGCKYYPTRESRFFQLGSRMWITGIPDVNIISLGISVLNRDPGNHNRDPGMKPGSRRDFSIPPGSRFHFLWGIVSSQWQKYDIF